MKHWYCMAERPSVTHPACSYLPQSWNLGTCCAYKGVIAAHTCLYPFKGGCENYNEAETKTVHFFNADFLILKLWFQLFAQLWTEEALKIQNKTNKTQVGEWKWGQIYMSVMLNQDLWLNFLKILKTFWLETGDTRHFLVFLFGFFCEKTYISTL